MEKAAVLIWFDNECVYGFQMQRQEERQNEDDSRRANLLARSSVQVSIAPDHHTLHVTSSEPEVKVCLMTLSHEPVLSNEGAGCSQDMPMSAADLMALHDPSTHPRHLQQHSTLYWWFASAKPCTSRPPKQVAWPFHAVLAILGLVLLNHRLALTGPCACTSLLALV